MDQKYIIANWKMNLPLGESIELAKNICKKVKKVKLSKELEIILCPSFEALAEVNKVLGRSGIALGAQDVFWQEHGAFTGEVSPVMLAEVGCKYVIVGHSERRKYLGETNEMINRKISAALAGNLVPILCVGETIEERTERRQNHCVMTQVLEGLNGIELTEGQKIIIAYEPVWVIGTGQAIDGQEASKMASVIRQTLIDMFPLEVVKAQTTIIYGGSVDAQNIKPFMDVELIQGALVGGASLKAEKFVDLLEVAD